MTRKVSFKIEVLANTFGWAWIEVRADERKVDISPSDVGGDSLGDLIKEVAKLTTTEGAVQVWCHEEPADVVIRLKRCGDDVEVLITRYLNGFDGAARIGEQQSEEELIEVIGLPDKEAFFREHSSFRALVQDVVAAMRKIESRLGLREYKKRWGFPFPNEDLAALEAFLAAN